ncbi:MAG: type II secretion system protein [Bacillota bacterium]
MRRLGKKGATLTELMASLAILSIILAPISLVFYLGYKNFFFENDVMAAQQRAKEVLDMINSDLRMFENEYTEVDNITKSSVIIKDAVHFPGEELIYTYSPDQKKIFKNGIAVFNEDEEVEVTGFEIEEVKPSDYDSSLININITVKVGKSDMVNLQSGFRRKAK